MKRLVYILYICIALLPLFANAQQVGKEHFEASTAAVTNHPQAEEPVQHDSVIVSLLTVTEGNLVYELYGHTAIRVKEVGKHQSDWVFNYGTFSFQQPHFMWRFILGQTDYELGVVPYAFFYDAYVREGRGITEQVINLTSAESKRLVDALSENLLPQNATYRYNFFYDNCTTRAIKVIERAINGTVVWGEVDQAKSLRNIVDEFSQASPWNKFGQNLLLGAEADAEADVHKQMFAPLYAERYITDAMVKGNDGTVRHLVAPARTLLPAQPQANNKFPISPLTAFGTLLVVTIGIGIIEYYKKKICWQYDVLLYLAQGLTGLIIAFLFFFSEHPAVGSNWLVLMFNPLPLVFFAWYMKQAVGGKRCWSMWVESVMLISTLIVGIAGLQTLPVEVYLIIATLFVRLVAQYVNIPRSVSIEKK